MAANGNPGTARHRNRDQRVGMGLALRRCCWPRPVAHTVPRPSDHADLRTGGVYQIVRHPIYGGSMLVALGWSLLSSPVTVAATAVLVALFEAKARLEETMLVARYPEYERYRRRVRWRFVPGVR